MAALDDFEEEDENFDSDDTEEYSFFEAQDVDWRGNNLFISVKGVDDRELAHFGGLDLHVKAVKSLISNTKGTDFARNNGDLAIEGKVFALYLNEIGELVRTLYVDSDILKGISNMELVKNFMEHWHEDNELVPIVEKDNEETRKEREQIEKEEDENFPKH